MLQSTAYTITFVVYFLIIALLCIAANRYNNRLSDYVLGGRRLSGPIAALAAGASDMGGWLLLALPGAFFLHGLNQIWMPIGLSIGAYINWLVIAKRLRVYTQKANNALTIPAYLDNRFRDQSTLLRAITAIVVLVFFTFYAAAGFVSGAVLFQSAFHLPYNEALWIGAGIVMLYTAIGGFLALSWIDFFQGTLMFIALVATPLVTFSHLGSFDTLYHHLDHINPPYLHPFAHMNIISILSLLGWGLGYFGQPHILVRFMAVKSVQVIPQARRICMTWMCVSLLGAMATGILGHAYFGQQLDNPERVFLALSEKLFFALATGVLLSAVLSALMSTVSAQLLSASSALTADFYHRYLRRQAQQKELVIMSRVAVIIIALLAIWIAHTNHRNSILQLVSYAWGGLGAAFGPTIILSLFWKRMTRAGAIAGVLSGALTIIVWKLVLSTLGGVFSLYEIIPGYIISTLAIIIASTLSQPPSAAMAEEFNAVQVIVDEES